MKEVYIVKHDVYSYEGCSYESLVEVFCDEDSARNYFEIKKEEIIQEYYNYIQEYYDYTGSSSVQELEDNFGFYSDSEPTTYGEPYLFVDLNDYGSDRLVVQKKDVMTF